MDDTSLVELFHAELRAHLGALDAALGSLANRTNHRVSAGIGADLLRAAHSLKGAAKIMGLREAERLGRAMEAQCAMVERGGTLSPELVRALSTAGAILGGLTSLPEAGFAGWEAQQRAAIDDQIAALEGAPTPPAAPSASHEIETATDDGMLEMFRLEVETQAAAMSDRLVALEADPTQLDALEPVMRAAHSIKGAARIVGIDPAVRLAHSMEDLLIAMQRQRAGVTPHAIDMLLRCTDLLVQAAESTRGSVASWTHVHGGEVDDLCSTLGVLMRAPASALAVEKRTLARDEGGAVDKAGVQDRVVRVSAANIDRLMGLAGESLVEARRMQPFADSLHGLLQRQSGLRDVLEELAYAPPERAGALLAVARERAQECKAAVIERVTEFEGFVRRSEDVTTRLYRETIASRMRPFADGVKGFARLIRDLSRKLGKEVELVIAGGDVGVDRDILEKIEAPLTHLARNAIDHGIEPPAERTAAGKPPRATLRLEARHWAGMLSITVSDDGRGIDRARVRAKAIANGLVSADDADQLSDAAILEYLFVPGFTTAEAVTEISGRGVGLDVVHSVLHEVGGTVRVSSERGRGTAFHLQLPITLSVVRAVAVEIAGEPYAFPLTRIERIVDLPAQEVQVLEGRPYFTLEHRNIGIVPAAQLLELEGTATPTGTLPIVVVSDRAHTFGLAVDRFLGEIDLVVRPLDPRLGKVADISAAAIMADGRPILIVDVEDLVRSAIWMMSSLPARQLQVATASREVPAKHILVVDDTITVREVQRQLLEARGYRATVAVDGMDGWQRVRSEAFDLVITDVDMPRLSGIDLVRSIKADARLAHLPVMIVSYRDKEEDRRRGLEVGANYYLTKSDFHDEALVQAVIELIGEPR